MMRLVLHVDYVDGSGADVNATAPDLIAFERKFNQPFTILGDGLRLEYILWISWYSLQRRNEAEKDFDEWADRVAGVRFGEQDPEPVPLESNQPTGS